MAQTVQQLLQTARQQLAKLVPQDEAGIEARLLLMHVLEVNHAWLLTHATDTPAEIHAQTFQRHVQRRLQGEPVAYILSYREFFGLKLRVTPDTLIPRPDTEILVETALAKVTPGMQVLDLGTGTGAIALAIAQHAPQVLVTAVDASQGALSVAESNLKHLQLHNVSLCLSHWFDALPQRVFDLIVSNPPYIEDSDPHLNQGDLRFEPPSALASGADGLQDIRHIAAHATSHLNPGGWLMLEHGYNQADAVQELLNTHGFRAVETIKDLGGQPRVTIGQWPGRKPV
jgi:release factor glutamine methyltransferase